MEYQTSEKNSRKIGCFQDIVFSGYFHYTHWVLSGCRDYYIYSQNGILFETIAPISDVSHDRSCAAGNFLRI